MIFNLCTSCVWKMSLNFQFKNGMKIEKKISQYWILNFITKTYFLIPIFRLVKLFFLLSTTYKNIKFLKLPNEIILHHLQLLVKFLEKILSIHGEIFFGLFNEEKKKTFSFYFQIILMVGIWYFNLIFIFKLKIKFSKVVVLAWFFEIQIIKIAVFNFYIKQ